MRAMVVGAVLACALLAGCGRPTTEPGAENGSAPAASGAATRSAEPATVADASPPPFAPEYPGSEVITNISAVENGHPGGIFAFRTPDAPSKVLAFYRARAVAAGMTAPPVASADQIFMARGGAGDLSVTVSPVEGATHGQVTWSAR